MKIAIIKYNAGNIYSVEYALKRLGIKPIVTADKEKLLHADKIIFPGVGEAATTMEYLKKEGLQSFIKDLKQPVLGICLGMQLMCQHSEEGDTDGLSIFPVNVKRFTKTNNSQKIPHMGWNTLTQTKSELFKDFTQEEYVYFVHSFYVPVNEFTTAQTEYILPFSAALHKDNFYATQFHPEKSGNVGEKILRNFLEL